MVTSGSSVRQSRWRADPPQPALVRFVLLSMLLHATIVILFGTSHGGGAGRGEGALDVLDVTLRRQPSVPDAGLRAGPGAETATGAGLLQRAEPQPVPVPPRRSETMPAIGPAKTGEPTPPASGETQPEAAPPMTPPAAEPLPRIDMRAPQEVDKPLIVPPTVERLTPPPTPPALAAPIDIAPLDIAPRLAAPPSAAPLERLSPPAIQPELAPPIEIAPRLPPAVPAPAAVPIERLAVPAAPKALAAPVEVPPREPTVVPAPIDRLAVPQVDQQLAPSPNLVAPSPSVAPPAAPPEAASSQVERAAPPASAKPTPVPAPSEGAAPAPGTTTQPRLRLGSPGPDEDMFKPRRDVVGPAGESGAPRIDMDAARQRARDIASETTSTRGILPALPPPPERISKESHALEKAVKPDCRTAYAGMGLLAVPALVASTIGDGGCRW